MSWLTKLLPPKIKREQGPQRRGALPEGLWSKCSSCEAVLYATDLENNLQVCPKCGHHNRLDARQRLDLLLDTEDRFEIGADVVPLDSLKFKDSKTYPERLMDANQSTGESDSLVVLQGAIKTIPVVAAAIEFDFMGRAHLRGKIAPVATSESTGRNRKIKTIALNRTGIPDIAAYRISPVYLAAANSGGSTGRICLSSSFVLFGK